MDKIKKILKNDIFIEKKIPKLKKQKTTISEAD